MIIDIAHITCPGAQSSQFYKLVYKSINDMQKNGLEVEVQYQQSDMAVSALILGRNIR